MDSKDNQKVNFRLLVDSIFTVDQLISVKDDIRTISGILYKIRPGSFSNQIKTKVGPNLNFYISSLEAEGRLPAPSSLGNFLADLARFLDNIDKITLTLAFAPSLDFQKEVVLWLEKNLGKKIIADFAVDEAIIAGLVIEYMGKYKDYSKASEIKLGIQTA